MLPPAVPAAKRFKKQLYHAGQTIEVESDTDTESMSPPTPPKKKQKIVPSRATSSTEIPGGPRTYEDSLRCAHHAVIQMVTYQRSADFDMLLGHTRLVMTTDYSGMGGPEMAVDMVKDSFFLGIM